MKDRSPLDSAWKRQFRRRLLAWFGRHARDFPWRRDCDAYKVWVSEVMLQQTQAATVVPYFERFTRRFPNVRSLAEAREEDVLKLWEGLGYYRRARRLHATARRIVERHGGELPRELEALRSLPGIGRYTAGAIASIAFDQPSPIVEANTQRLFARLLALRGDVRTADSQQRLWRFAEDVLPRRGAGRFNQALMELGALVCTPRAPRCPECPVASLCAARRAGIEDKVPAQARRPKFEDVSAVAVVIRHRGKVLVLKRQAAERWAGLWDFPRVELPADAAGNARAALLRRGTLVQTGLAVRLGRTFATLKHGVTRFRITLECRFAACDSKPPREHGRELLWATPRDLAKLPLCSTGRKIATLLAGGGKSARPRDTPRKTPTKLRCSG